MMKKIRTYSDLQSLHSYKERFEYLKLDGEVGKETFGFDRYLNQTFYKSPEWRKIRDQVIFRDNGCDLGVEGYEIQGKILIHHINPITQEDIVRRRPEIFDLNNLVCVTQMTHNAIHYGDESLLMLGPIERKPNDTCPWKH